MAWVFRQRDQSTAHGPKDAAKEAAKEERKKKLVSTEQEPDSTATAHVSALSLPVAPAVPAGGEKVAKSAANSRAEVVKWATRALEKGINGLREEFMGESLFIYPFSVIYTFISSLFQNSNATVLPAWKPSPSQPTGMQVEIVTKTSHVKTSSGSSSNGPAIRMTTFMPSKCPL